MRLTISAAALAAALAAAPALAQTDAEKAEALRSAAETLRQAIETLEQAATTLEGGAGDADAADAEAEQADGNDIAAAGGGVEFLDPLDNKPLDIPSEDVTEAVTQFHATGENPYSGDAEAIAEGRKLYDKLCAACHLKDATGRIGPNLIDDTSRYSRTNTAQGQFEIIYAGGAGAMQPFHSRISQDEILRVIAYVESLAGQ